MVYLHHSYGQRSWTAALALPCALAVFLAAVALENTKWIWLDLLITGVVWHVVVLLLLLEE